MAVGIVEYETPDDTHRDYDVELYHDRNHRIRTIVTCTPSYVDEWIADTESIHHRRLHRLIVGLDVEWRPNFIRGGSQNPIATIQLCVGRRCLIFQLLYCPYIPQSLIEFLNNESYTFVGVGIDSDVDKLIDDHDLTVANTVDLRQLAAQAYEAREFFQAGLKMLAREVLGIDVHKPRGVTMSRWDNEWLTPDQVPELALKTEMADAVWGERGEDRGRRGERAEIEQKMENELKTKKEEKKTEPGAVASKFGGAGAEDTCWS